MPELLDDLFDRDDLVCVQQEQCEERALLAPTKRHKTTAVVMNLQRPENAEVHRPPNPSIRT